MLSLSKHLYRFVQTSFRPAGGISRADAR